MVWYNITMKPLFNPDTEDFTWEYLDEDNKSQVASMRSQEITYFSEWLAERMATHLTDKLYHKRGQILNAEDDMKAIRAEIEVVL